MVFYHLASIPVLELPYPNRRDKSIFAFGVASLQRVRLETVDSRGYVGMRACTRSRT